MYGNKNRNENITKPCWNIFWREGPASYFDKYTNTWNKELKTWVKGAIVPYKNQNKGLRLYNKATVDKKLIQLRNNPEVTEIHVVYTEPQGLMVRDGDGNWMHEKSDHRPL